MYKLLNATYRNNSEFWAVIVLLSILILKSYSTSANNFTDNTQVKFAENNADTVKQEEKFSIFMIGATFGNNSSYLGRFQSARLPYISNDLTYRHKSGLWVSAIAYDIIQSNSFIDEVDIMGGWNFDLSKKVDGSIYYSRYFFSPDSELLKSSVTNAVNAFIGVDYNILYSRLTFSQLFQGADDFFLILDHSRYFEIDKVFHKSDYISIEPKFSLISGTQSFVESHLVKNSNIFSPPVSPRGPGSTQNNDILASEEVVVKNFNIMAYELSMPVSYTFKKLTLELSGRYIIPVNLTEGDASRPQMFLTTGLMYAIY